MQYKVKIRDVEYRVDAIGHEDAERVTAVFDDGTEEVGFHVCGADRVQIRRGDSRTNLFLARDAGGVWVWVEGKPRYVTAATGRRSAATGIGGSDKVTPPTPATVTRVTAEVGQSVEKGTDLVTVSAMKMEMTLCAPYAGVVRSVNVAVGDQVAPGDILVEIDPTVSEASDE
jgi:biotin carboxyl carrier protein